LVAEHERSGLSVAEFCRQKVLTENSFYRWRRQLADDDESRFAPVSIVGSDSIDIELPCGATVKVAANRETLRDVFTALLTVEAVDA
jgi:transposase-like protein